MKSSKVVIWTLLIILLSVVIVFAQTTTTTTTTSAKKSKTVRVRQTMLSQKVMLFTIKAKCLSTSMRTKSVSRRQKCM